MNGIIIVYKEKGFTSFDVVAKLRGILKQKKIGHTGTLDPDAVGVLPVCLGNATKLCDMLTDKKKEYIAEFILGKETDTQDISGKLIKEREVSVTETEVVEAVSSFIGNQEQLPPMYSAIKVDGKRLYELARQGKDVERKTRPVTFFEIEILKMELPYVTVRVLCSKGTYIRTLCHDIGRKLVCGAAMTSLERIRSGQFTKEQALTLAQIERLCKEGKLDSIIMPVDAVFKSLPSLVVTGEWEKKIKNGNCIFGYDCKKLGISALCIDKQKIKVYRENNNSCNFIAVYQYSNEKKGIVPDKMFLDR